MGWDDKSESVEDSNKLKGSFSCFFMTFSNEVTNVNSKLGNSIDQLICLHMWVITCTDDLPNEMTSSYLKSKALKLKPSSLSKEIKISKNMDEQHWLNEDILRIENENLQAQNNDNATI